jgi:hypothetical protein
VSVSAFPIPMPTTGFVEADFNPMRRQSAGVFASGRDLVIDNGQPQWSFTLKTKPLFNAEIGQWKAWRDALRGGGRFALVYDPWREYPHAYMPKGWTAGMTRWDASAWDGTAVLGAISNSGLDAIGRDVVQLWDLPNALAMNPGDYVGLQWSSDAPAPPTADFSSGANSWAATNGTFASSSGYMLFTPTGANAYLARTGLSLAGATYTRLLVDVERTVTGGTAFNGLDWVDGSSNVRTITGIRWPSTLARARLVIDLSGDANWIANTVTAIRLRPVSTAAGAFLFRSVRLESGVAASQKYSLHRVLDPAQVSASAAGQAQLWVEPELPSSVPAGAKVNLWRAACKIRKTDFQLPINAQGRNRPGQATFSGLSTLL